MMLGRSSAPTKETEIREPFDASTKGMQTYRNIVCTNFDDYTIIDSASVDEGPP